jgi:NADH-quinone oxidoreductase subunit L
VGKSAQLPLQTWLPDAMAGPTPVSALIHAATMVTAGVYLIARTHALFDLSPTARAVVAIIGAATLLLAACSALAQRDIKRCLAYSTISQIGYMFLALGVGAYTAGMFHFMTHAFFKSLLFLAAGVVILAMRHQHDMTKMGGLRKSMPVTFWTFLAGASSLAALPLVTAGFYSKDLILLETFAVSPGLWAVGLAGAFITAVYSFRMVFLVFFGSNRTTGVSPVNSSHTEPTGGTPVVQYPTGLAMGIPLAILAGASIVGGFVQTPGSLGDLGLFAGFMGHALPTHAAIIPTAGARIEEIISALVPLLGLAVAWLVYVAKPSLATGMATRWAGLRRFWLGGWGFDWLYQRLVVWPFLGLAKLLRSDLVDRVYRSGAAVTLWVGAGASRTQTGQLRWYAAAIVLGAIVILAIVVLT